MSDIDKIEHLVELIDRSVENMKSPLTAMMGMCEVALEDIESGRGARPEDLHRIYANAERLLTMLDALTNEAEAQINPLPEPNEP